MRKEKEKGLRKLTGGCGGIHLCTQEAEEELYELERPTGLPFKL